MHDSMPPPLSGMLEFLRKPFGVTNNPSTFQRFFDSVLKDHHSYCSTNLDNKFICGDTSVEVSEEGFLSRGRSRAGEAYEGAAVMSCRVPPTSAMVQ